MKRSIALIILCALGWPSSSEAGTLKAVKDRGYVVCGVSNGVRGFAFSTKQEQWSGFDVDFCRAIAAAIFGDDTKYRVVPLSPVERFEALKSKKIDVLASNATWTMSRELENQIVFTGVTYFDQQGFMVPRSKNLVSLNQLEGARVCMEAGTTNENNFIEFAKNKNITFTPVTSKQLTDLISDYEAGKCDVITSDSSQLYAQKLELSRPQDHEIIKDTISLEPIGPSVRQDDIQWIEIIKWINFALLNAETLGLSQANIDASYKSQADATQRFIGEKDEFGRKLGLDSRWAYNIVLKVGNYGEILERRRADFRRAFSRTAKSG
jgi:general L-amino acid transport system substrate-binding protein